MRIVNHMTTAQMATVEFEITVHSVGIHRFGDFPPDNIEDILERLRNRDKVEEVYDDSAEREAARLRELRRLERIRKRKIKRAKKLLKISIPSAELKYDEEIVEYDGLRRISQRKYIEFVALIDQDKADRLKGRIANKEEIARRKARLAKLKAAQRERALILAHERARKWGVNAISTDVARDSEARNRLNDLLRKAGIIVAIKHMAQRLKERVFGAPNSDDELDDEDEEETIDSPIAGKDEEKEKVQLSFMEKMKSTRDNLLIKVGLMDRKTDPGAILSAMRGPDEADSSSDSD
jgi:hypothetical protein